VPSGTQDWVGRADIMLTDNGKGGLTGTLTGTQLQTLQLSRCHADTRGTISAELKGTLTEQKMTVSVLNGKSDWPPHTTCREGGTAGTGAPVLKWPQFDEVFEGLAPDAVGNFIFDRAVTFKQTYPTAVHYTLKLTRSK
jgi:hypothetical protein